MFNESTVYNDTQNIISTVIERLNENYYDSNVTDHAEYLINESHDIFNQKVLVEWLMDKDLSDDEYHDELEAWVTESLESLANELRDSEEVAHEWADSDQRVIYTYKTIEYYQDNTNAVEERAAIYGVGGDISEQITAGVYGCIYDDHLSELNALANDIESYDAEDFI